MASPESPAIPPGPAGKPRGRVPFLLAGFFMAVYFINIAVGMAAVKLGWQVSRLGDLSEFLVVLVSMIFFVAGVLAVEDKRPEKPQSH